MNTRLLHIGLFSLVLCVSPNLWADEDEHEHRGSATHKTDFAPVQNKPYQEECGGCHMAYPVDALPARSWKKLMSQLNDHFGENAELSSETHKEISLYLQNNAAEQSSYPRVAKMIKGVAANQTPLRISELPYFVREHRGIEKKIKGNEKVKSISQCNSCHSKAESGSYREREINIPGIGRWED